MKPKQFTVIPIGVSKKFGTFDLGGAVSDAISDNGQALEEGDVVVVSSKFAAMSEGRCVGLKTVAPSKEAIALSEQYELDPALAELILGESQVILGGIKGFVLAVAKGGILAPNAGIDRSNVPHGYAILYPEDPKRTAEGLRDHLLKSSKSYVNRVAVILSDSRITPARLGTIGIAIATSGMSPVEDFRGHRDLFGNELKVTVRAVADEICSAAQLVMGEAAESVPIAIARGYDYADEENSIISMVIPPEQCLYIQGLSNKTKLER